MIIREDAAALYRETGNKTNLDWPFYSKAQRRGARVRCGNLAGQVDPDAVTERSDDYYALLYLDVVAIRLGISINPGQKGYERARIT